MHKDGENMGRELKYQVMDNDNPYKVMTAREVAEHFGITLKRARNLCSTGERFLKRFRIERLTSEESVPQHACNYPDELLKEWDSVRLRLNPNAKR